MVELSSTALRKLPRLAESSGEILLNSRTRGPPTSIIVPVLRYSCKLRAAYSTGARDTDVLLNSIKIRERTRSKLRRTRRESGSGAHLFIYSVNQAKHA